METGHGSRSSSSSRHSEFTGARATNSSALDDILYSRTPSPKQSSEQSSANVRAETMETTEHDLQITDNDLEQLENEIVPPTAESTQLSSQPSSVQLEHTLSHLVEGDTTSESPSKDAETTSLTSHAVPVLTPKDMASRRKRSLRKGSVAFSIDASTVGDSKVDLVLSNAPFHHTPELDYHRFLTSLKRDNTREEKEFKSPLISFREKGTLVAKALTTFTVPKQQSLSYNSKDAQNGIRLLDTITKIPLGKIMQLAVEILAIGVFLLNFCVNCADIALDFPDNLGFKVPALLVSIVENIVVIGLYIRKKRREARRKRERELKEAEATSTNGENDDAARSSPGKDGDSPGTDTAPPGTGTNDATADNSNTTPVNDATAEEDNTSRPSPKTPHSISPASSHAEEHQHPASDDKREENQAGSDDTGPGRVGSRTSSAIKPVETEDDIQRVEKNNQYIQNILHEVLLYPLIIFNVFTLATEKPWENQEEGDAFYYVQLVLLIIDFAELFWTYGVRLYMLNRLIQDIEQILDPEDDDRGCCNWNLHGAILPRAYITTLGNTLLFMGLMFMLGAQVHKDNLEHEDYRATWRSGVLILCVILIPLYSIFMFFVCNAYWVLEILMKINEQAASQQSDLQAKFKGNYGQVAGDAMDFAVKQANSTTRRLRELNSLSAFKKATFGLVEVPVVCMLVLWEAIFAAAILTFEGFDTTAFTTTSRVVIIVFVALANLHTFGLALVVNFVINVVFLGVLLYPLSIILCFRKKLFVKMDDDDIV